MAASAVPHAFGVRRRWLSLAAGVLVEAASGMFYAFSLYSIRLQTQFHLSQQNTDLIATMANVGGNFGVHIGFFYRRYGPRGTLLLAAVFGLSGERLWAASVVAFHRFKLTSLRHAVRHAPLYAMAVVFTLMHWSMKSR
eukprot:6174036-Pleurochrysis_carterae.AAC.3